MEIETLLRRRKYGFQGMTPERRREIAALGGKAAHRKGRAHKWTSEEAARAGRKGGRGNIGVKKRKRWMVAED